MLPAGLPNIAAAAWEPWNVGSFALSLMLVFRTNSSYARWVEARALWSIIINSTLNLVRQSISSFPDADLELRVALGRWAVAFVRACKLHLREDGELVAEMKVGRATRGGGD